MNEDKLSAMRHTLAHLLAAAVHKLYPHAKPTIGPAVENGFYYDFDFDGGPKPSEPDLQKIEQKMRELLKKWDVIKGEEVSKDAVCELFAKNPYKLELIDEILERKEPLTLYHSGPNNTDLVTENALFTDLCRGGHTEHPGKEIAGTCFKLDRIAGAYWRGDEKNTMLTRIYGLAFENKEGLEKYEVCMEEAKKRDHRKLGKELDLFTFSDLVGPGLPLWTPKGTMVRDLIDEYVWELRSKYHYTKVTIPHITKKELYERSGHWDKFSDELFHVHTREGKEYALKPMNCPHHTQIFDRHPHSYRDMPQRYAETTMVYRDEQSGELGGLTRVLSITQDDSHVFCRHSKVKDEFFAIWDIVDTFYTTFNFPLTVRLSFHDPESFDKYLGTKEVWENAENALREIAVERNANFVEALGEAAMYGPKLDFMATDSIGREHQVATIQLDMNMPERFDLTCINEQGEKERIVMIHAAITGSIERFMAVLLEHLSGVLPFWLAPEQVRILPISENHHEYAQKVYEALTAVGIRVKLDESNDSLGKRIRTAKIAKLPYFVVLGDKEVQEQKITLEGIEKEEHTLDSLVMLLKLKNSTREN